MFKVLRPVSDTYITNKIIGGNARTGSNVGQAGTLNLFKIYGVNTITGSAVVELSRCLIKFDIEPLVALYASGNIDITHNSFNVQLKLFDVYGGQTTPSNFTVDVYPLSRSFDEGDGRDVIKHADLDACNYVTASWPNTLWYAHGANYGSTVDCDYITYVGSIPMKSSQLFTTGEENLTVDVTRIISATLKGDVPDAGFRLSFSQAIEVDTKTYFVKRFAGRNAYNEDKHPVMNVRFDDSIQDDSQALELDTGNNVFLYNYVFGSMSNLISASSSMTGANCLKLRLTMPISGGAYNLAFTGSQHNIGVNYTSGTYKAVVTVPANNVNVTQHINVSGSVKFTPIWTTFDETYVFVTGSALTFWPPHRTGHRLDRSNHTVTATGVKKSHKTDENVIVRVNIFDYQSPKVKLVKLPIELPGEVVRNVYYQIRDVTTSDAIIPFDVTYGSTKCSSDDAGMYFILDTSNLRDQRTYVIDILMKVDNESYVYKDVSAHFRVNDLTG